MPSKFIHLNLHSEYSVVDSILHIPNIMDALKNSQSPAVGITDFNNMYAAIKFYKAALAAGIKPLMGAEVLVFNEEDADKSYSMTFLCMNNQGYLNLSELISKAHQSGYHKTKPMVHENWIEKYNEGLIAISNNMRGDIGQLILNKKLNEAADKVEHWKRIFSDRFYLSIARINRKDEKWHNNACIYLAAHQQVPLVATNDARFMQTTDFNAHEARVCINQGLIVADPRRQKVYTRDQYLSTPEEMIEKFKDLPEALENTVEIAKRCHLVLN